MCRAREIFCRLLFLVALGPIAPDKSWADSELRAEMIYSRKGRIEGITLGEREARDLGPGMFARWSANGKRIAVYSKGAVFVMDHDGKNRVKLTDKAGHKHGCPIEFLPDNESILFWRKSDGFQVIDIPSKKIRPFLPKTSLKLTGEPSISGDGQRFAARAGNQLFAIDLDSGRHVEYAKGCSPGVSPSGVLLMNNVGSHRHLEIRPWPKGERKRYLNTRKLNPDKGWDNHHWSNHENYIAAQGEDGRGESYAIHIPDNRIIRASWNGGTSYPDLFVHETKSVAVVKEEEGDEKVAKGRLSVVARLIEKTPTPKVESLEDYTRALGAYAYEVVKADGMVAGTHFLACHGASPCSGSSWKSGGDLHL